MDKQPLVIEQRIRDMMRYGHIALRQFPKSEKHVLAAEIRTSMLTLLRLVITAAKRYHQDHAHRSRCRTGGVAKPDQAGQRPDPIYPSANISTGAVLNLRISGMIGGWLKYRQAA